MQQVGKFEKVSFDQFRYSFAEVSSHLSDYGVETLSPSIYDAIKLPKRATTGSAGYDFFAPYPFSLSPGHSIKIPTGIRAEIDEGWWLGILPRSGHGFKYRIQLDNTFPVIDSDYYFSDNEGHIFLKLTNDSKENKTLIVNAGDGIAQGIFLPYGITYDDDTTGVRNGGFGSTDGK